MLLKALGTSVRDKNIHLKRYKKRPTSESTIGSQTNLSFAFIFVKECVKYFFKS